MRRLTILSLVISSGVACGEFTDAGDGSGTLEVEASAEYDIDDDQTDIRVRVRVPSGSSESAQVRVIEDDSGETRDLERIGANGNRTTFEGVFAGYAQRLELDVRRGSDRLTARLEGPGRHVVTNPVNGDVLPPREAFEIKWSVEDGLEADQVEVTLDEADFDVTLLDDDGNQQISSSTLRPGDETVRVERSNVLLLAGGASGSVFRMVYPVKNDFVVSP